jgi:hypothetical protein
MPIHTICTSCGKALSVADEHAGKRAKCPACGHIYTVPLASALVADQQPSTGSNLAPASGQADWATLEPTSALPDQFWMQTADGQVFGPTDRNTLNRWFYEGRVGNNYKIRVGETENWMDASLFRPGTQAASQVHNSGNPYSVPGAATVAGSAGVGLHQYPKKDKGVLVLVMGILSFAVCAVFGIVGIIMGRTALNEINSGQADPKDKTLATVGFWLSVVSLVLNFLFVGLFVILGLIGALAST